MAVQELISCSLGFVDNLMVGSLGEAELSAVGVAVQVFFVHYMVLYGFVTGTATFMAQFYGSGEIRNIRKTTGLALTVGMAISIVFFLLGFFFPEKLVRIFTNIPSVIPLATEYVKIGSVTFLTIGMTIPFTSALRATQQTKIPLYISFATFGTNTILNYILIFGKFGAPEMRVAGAATATVIARILEVALTLFFVFGRKNIIAGSFSDFFGWHKELAQRIVKNAIPTTVNETLWGLGTSMYMAAFARLTEEECAAVQAANTINNLFSMTAFSVASASLILVGQKLGEGELDYAFELGRKLRRVGIAVGAIAGVLLIAAAKPLISLFAFEDITKNYCFWILVVYGVILIFNLHNGMLIAGILRAGGDTRFAMFCDGGCIWLIGVPLAFITALVLHLPIYFCVLLTHSEEIIKFCITTFRFKSKKWVHNVITDIE